MSAGRVLVVCTGNVCRSPYIERLLAQALAPYDVEVESAGTHALAGEPMAEGSARLLRRSGVVADDFVARQLTPAIVQSADLVLTATREHRRDVVRMTPRALRHTHALADFSDLVAGAELPRADGNLIAQLAAGAVARRGQVPVRDAADAEIIDPFRRGDEVFDQMAAQVGKCLPAIVEATRRLASAP